MNSETIKLKKHLGQHLLLAQGVLEKIAEFAEIKEGEVLLEIGPGTGHLTRFLLQYPLKRLYLLEIDPEMINYLKTHFQDERLIILQADAKDFDYRSLKEEKLKLIGNLPYNVASLIVENVIYYHELIYEALFMVQKEVAEKWLSGKSWLSLFIQTFYDLKYLMTLPPKFFKPKPKVDSALIKFIYAPKERISDLKAYKKFLTYLYQHKRKMLRKKFPQGLLEGLKIPPTARAEELNLREVLLLFQHYFSQKERL